MPSDTASSEGRIVEAVHLVTRTLSSTLDHKEGLRRTLVVAAWCVGAAGGSIWEHDPVGRKLICRHVLGNRADALIGFAIGDAEGIAGQVFQSRTARNDPHPQSDPQHARRVDECFQHETHCLLTVPLCYPGGVAVGVMQLVNKRSGCFTPDDQRVLDIVSDIAAMRLHNADLAEQAGKTEALGYVAGFAHDIYNKLASLVTGLPTLRLLLTEVFDNPCAHGKEEVASQDALARLRADAFAFVEFMERDADLVHRYARCIARLATGKPLDTHFEQADLTKTVRAQLDQLWLRALENRAALTLACEKPVFVLHDRLLMGSAVYNLVNNALPEARAGGTVCVRVWEETGFAVVEVRDTGRGMPAALLDAILRGNPISAKPGGSGIGTLIVKKVAEVHGGTLEGESTPGVGTTFRIRLPLQPPDPDPRGER